MKTVKLENIKVGDCFTIVSRDDVYVYNICLSRNNHGMTVLRIDSQGSDRAFMPTTRYADTQFFLLKLNKKGFSFV